MIRSPLGRLGIAGMAGLLAVGALAAPAVADSDGTIQGTFTTSSGVPVSAWVYIISDDFATQLNIQTDAAGAFDAQVPPGDYKISFSWDSATQWVHDKTDMESADPITVAAGQTVDVDEQAMPTGSVSGHLTAANGTPLASTQVVLHHGYDQVGSATTDANGDYSFGQTLARDGYTVSFGLGTASQWVAGALDQGKARVFTVTADAPTTVDDQQLATGSLHGRLTDPDGTPDSRFQVSATLDGESAIDYTATTDGNGEWSLPTVFKGKYRVSFVTPANQRTQWAYGAGTAADAKLIAVGAGKSVAVDETWLPDAELVIKTVDSATGAPVSNFCTWVGTPNNASDCTSGSEDTVYSLPGGTFDMQVYPDYGGYYLNTRDIPVTLTAGQTTTVTVPLVEGGRVAYSAADHATGAPVAGACGRLKAIGQGGLGDDYANCTDATGKAVTSGAFAPGAYELFAVAPGSYGDQWVGPDGGTGDQQAAARIVVQPGQTVTAPPALLDPAGTITGVVTGSDGKPPADGYVAFSAWDQSGPNWDTGVDENGRYTLDKLGPYAWPLLFGGGIDPRQWSGHVGDRFQAAGVPVTAGGTTTYNMTLSHGTTLKGKVSIPAGPSTSWSLVTFDAATGDQMDVVGGIKAGPYSLQVTGGAAIKIHWDYSRPDPLPGANGWYDGATGLDTATQVAIPAKGTKKLNLTLG
jgi:hypothetical protein